jgi:CheY-like chemotaxis protein
MTKILITDDDPVTRGIMEEILGSVLSNVEILLASNGREAVEITRAEEPDIVFLDGMMPEMDGFEACDIIRNGLNMKGVYIVMVTALDQPDHEDRGLQAGADQYMRKPFDPDDLIDIVEEITKKLH